MIPGHENVFPASSCSSSLLALVLPRFHYILLSFLPLAHSILPSTTNLHELEKWGMNFNKRFLLAAGRRFLWNSYFAFSLAEETILTHTFNAASLLFFLSLSYMYNLTPPSLSRDFPCGLRWRCNRPCLLIASSLNRRYPQSALPLYMLDWIFNAIVLFCNHIIPSYYPFNEVYEALIFWKLVCSSDLIVLF